MNFTLNRDRVYASTLGHSVEFKKGVPTHVPPALYAEVQTIGAIPEDDIPEADKPSGIVEPTDPHQRANEILTAIKMLAEKNDRMDFTALGAPHVKALAVLLGWKPMPHERDQLWARFQVDSKD